MKVQLDAFGNERGYGFRCFGISDAGDLDILLVQVILVLSIVPTMIIHFGKECGGKQNAICFQNTETPLTCLTRTRTG